MYGGSAGGWEAMGAQVFYPDEFNGVYIACPDPIDFRAYTTVNLYEDANAHDREGPWRRVARPGHRNYLGLVDTTIREMNTLELSYILRRDWATLGPTLRGKLHIYVGDMDNYYLNNAVYLVEEFLKTAKPAFEGEVGYGDRAEHCWNGDHARPNATSRLRYHQMFAPKILDRLLKTAPAGADTTSWRY